MRAVAGRTFVIGDVHGELEALERLLARLPLAAADTVVFLGDYVDRGPNPRGVVERVRRFVAESPTKTVTLRGNHEDKWVQSYEQPDLPFMVQIGNGCGNTYRSFVGGAPLAFEESLPIEELQKMLEVTHWFPKEVAEWMSTLPLWYEDDNGLYVHAGLEEDDAGGWKHPSLCQPKPLMWMREPKFFTSYRGKRLCVGHTPVGDLPLERPEAQQTEAYLHGDLAAIDTGAGKGGFLTAIELPSTKLYDSR